MTYAVEAAVTVLRFALSFYAFWLVWRVLLPHLPGPADRAERAAPFVWYFTDPFVLPIARVLRLPARLVALVALTAVAAASVGLARLPSLVT